MSAFECRDGCFNGSRCRRTPSPISVGLVAVMEVECRSRGESRCRFLAGAPETLSALYDRMAAGASYLEALGVSPDA